MARILITSGPTRQYLDPVRYLTNASSGRMGAALAAAALSLNHQVIVVTGPVSIEYPAAAKVVRVVTTDEMFDTCRTIFADCDGVIGAAAPCDYQPIKVETHKIAKTGEPLQLHLVETRDIIATLGHEKNGRQWVIGFALETDDARFRAITKLEKKHCDWIVLNGPEAMDAMTNSIEVLDGGGRTVMKAQGSKESVARQLMTAVHDELIAETDEDFGLE